MGDHHQRPEQWGGRSERWLSLLGGPLAAGIQLALSVPLLPLSCAIEWRTIYQLVSLVAALAAVGAGLLAWQQLQEQRAAPPAGRAPRLSSYAGLITNALALSIIGARWLAVLLVDCVTAL